MDRLAITPRLSWPGHRRSTRFRFRFVSLAASRVVDRRCSRYDFQDSNFFLSPLSLSEAQGFIASCISAASLVVIQLGLFAWSVAGRPRAAIAFTALVVVMFGGLFQMLRSGEHALLIGSIGLFAAIGVAMYLTRGLGLDIDRAGHSVTTPAIDEARS